ncbi:MAG TPA: NAD(P)-dependent oxidoreductase [Chloroflexota bacterium]|nr:NAD(P)-dependent oxidoreductase [Chloroflexota bacterium]
MTEIRARALLLARDDKYHPGIEAELGAKRVVHWLAEEGIDVTQTRDRAVMSEAGLRLRPRREAVTLPSAGVIGLGAMGGPAARNLAAAGYRVSGYDTSAERLAAASEQGVTPAPSVEALVDGCKVVLTSLPSSGSWVQLAERHLVPRACSGQLFIDLGTVAPPETRRLAAAFAAAGAALVDAPVSGGPTGAAGRTLFMFVGGDDEHVARARPVLEALAGLGRITHCGPSGAGQVVKGVNQLAMGLGAAAYLEAVAFGVNAGVRADVIGEAVGDDSGWRSIVGGTARRIAAGKGEEIGVKFRELPYFLREAQEAGFPLPLTEVLHALCDAGERVVVDDNRPAPSFYRELRAGRAQPG